MRDIGPISWTIRVKSIAVPTSGTSLAKNSSRPLLLQQNNNQHNFNLSKMRLNSYHSTLWINSISLLGKKLATKRHWPIRKLKNLLCPILLQVNLAILLISISIRNHFLENDMKKITTSYTDLPKRKCWWLGPSKKTTWSLSGTMSTKMGSTLPQKMASLWVSRSGGTSSRYRMKSTETLN